MPNARHPKKYPAGTALPVTRAWKDRVRLALHANLAAGRSPKNVAELADAVGAHKTGLGKMLKTEQPTYRYVQEICEALDIEQAMVPNPSVDPTDDVEQCITELRQLPLKRQRQAIGLLQAIIKQLDDE